MRESTNIALMKRKKMRNRPKCWTNISMFSTFDGTAKEDDRLFTLMYCGKVLGKISQENGKHLNEP